MMPIKAFCWTLSGIIAAIFGWFLVRYFVSTYGWVDPVAGCFIAPLVAWLLIYAALLSVVWRMKPLSLIEESGGFLYQLKRRNLIFKGSVYNKKGVTKDFRLIHLFYDYFYFPFEMKFNFRIERMYSGNKKMLVEVKDFGVKIETKNILDAMKVFEKYGHINAARKKIGDKIDKALEDAIANEILPDKCFSEQVFSAASLKLTFFVDLEKTFIKKVKSALGDESYYFDGSYFEISLKFK